MIVAPPVGMTVYITGAPDSRPGGTGTAITWTLRGIAWTRTASSRLATGAASVTGRLAACAASVPGVTRATAHPASRRQRRVALMAWSP